MSSVSKLNLQLVQSKLILSYCWITHSTHVSLINFNVCFHVNAVKACLLILSTKNLFSFKQLRDLAVIDNNCSIFKLQLNISLVSLKYSVWLSLKTKSLCSFTWLPLCFLFKNFNWISRENWEMFGVQFKSVPSRLLSDYTSNVFPLRKEFAIIGFIFQRSLGVKFVIDKPTANLSQVRGLL
jgi:NADH:ubiquinone oxidoreductase subunit C